MILLLAILLTVLVPLPEPWGAVAIGVGCVLEIGEVAVLRRWSKHMDRNLKTVTGADAMVGKTGTAVSACRPVGQVRVGGEIWTATCAEGVRAGESVRVDAVDEGDELTLVVSAHRSAARVKHPVP